MAIERHGDKLYINVTGKNYVAVVDKNTLTVLATWPITEAEQNAPMAFDEAGKRLVRGHAKARQADRARRRHWRERCELQGARSAATR